MTTTIELTRGELGILFRSATKQLHDLDQAVEDGAEKGWYDAKAEERVLVYQHQTKELVHKLSQIIKEMDA